MNLGIVISTYKRKDGKTPDYLKRALESAKNQTHKDYKVFLIGDDYEDNLEFEQIASSIIPHDKIYYENLPIAIERVRYPEGGQSLWRCGGANAFNYGIEKSINMGYEYVCHLDHDDYWHPQHLEFINSVVERLTNTAFVYTCSTYFNTILPNIKSDGLIHSYPEPSNVIHSSVCINHKKIPFKYRDTYYETGTPDASDADMWRRIKSFCIEKKYDSYLIPRVTCFHPQENS
jgi:glycosyltransferase involved in cell wall biosynthesis